MASDSGGRPSSSRGAAAGRGRHTYVRRQPEQSVLHRVVREHLETFLAEARQRGGGEGLPRFVERELREFLTCGVMARGFARFRCDGCAREILVAFSCKGRGFCPSCCGRRMGELAAHLVDGVLGGLPVRQWVLTLPLRLRYALAYDHRLCRAVLGVFVRALLGFERRRARGAGDAGARRGGDGDSALRVGAEHQRPLPGVDDPIAVERSPTGNHSAITFAARVHHRVRQQEERRQIAELHVGERDVLLDRLHGDGQRLAIEVADCDRRADEHCDAPAARQPFSHCQTFCRKRALSCGTAPPRKSHDPIASTDPSSVRSFGATAAIARRSSRYGGSKICEPDASLNAGGAEYFRFRRSVRSRSWAGPGSVAWRQAGGEANTRSRSRVPGRRRGDRNRCPDARIEAGRRSLCRFAAA